MNESVTGYIDHVIFRNEENGYTVMILKGVDGEEELTCVGTFPVLTMGASVELTGIRGHQRNWCSTGSQDCPAVWKRHPAYCGRRTGTSCRS